MSLHNHSTEQKTKVRQLRARAAGLSRGFVYPDLSAALTGVGDGSRGPALGAGRAGRRVGRRGRAAPTQVSQNAVTPPSLAFCSPPPTPRWLAGPYRATTTELPPEC